MARVVVLDASGAGAVAVIGPERSRGSVEALGLALALAAAVLGVLLGWNAHILATAPRVHAPFAAQRYVEALCAHDTAYLATHTGEPSAAPWEPRLTSWVLPCTGTRYLGSAIDLIGREQHLFTLLRPDGTEAIYIVTFGRDGLVAGME